MAKEFGKGKVLHKSPGFDKANAMHAALNKKAGISERQVSKAKKEFPKSKRGHIRNNFSYYSEL